MTKPKAKLRKTESDKDGNAPSTSGDNKTPENAMSNSPGSSASKNTSSAWFTSEIQAMMHGFGDCSKPLLESAKLIQEIVHQQMNSLLMQLAEIASNRGVRFIALEDIVFLLRKDKVKLSRLLHYLNVKDLKCSLPTKNPDDPTDEGGTDVVSLGGLEGNKLAPPVRKRLRITQICYDFISTIDQTGELSALLDEEMFDEVKHERDLRADSQAQSMDKTQYLEFAEARRANFARKYRSTKFRDWILKDNLVDIKPNTVALEILHYLAYETVAQLVDLTLLVKQDANARADDPVTTTMTPQCFNHDYPSVRLHQHVKSTVSTASTPPQSPRFTSPPVSPPPLSGSALGSQGTPSGAHQTTTTPTPKSKSKKRKRSGGHVNLEIPYSQMIHPADIREAVRRYWQPIGSFVPLSKVGSLSIGKRLLCS